MLSVIKSLPRQLATIGNCFSVSLKTTGNRTFFSPSYFGIESFKNYAGTMEKEHGKNASSLKVTIEEALAKPEAKIFTEDLKVMLYLTKSDADLDLLLNAIKKYQKQESLAIFSFNFETPLMRLLYSLNKTDKALELFLKEQDSILQRYFTAGTILLNKLLEEKRYNDAIKVVNKVVNKYRIDKQSDPNSRLKTMDLSNLVSEALLGKNNAEAMEQAKELLKTFRELNLELHDNAYIKLILLAHNQNQYDFAYELTSRIKNKGANIINNLKFLSLVKLNRLDDALQLAEDTNKINLNRGKENRLFFKETLAVLEQLAQQSGDKQKRVQDLVQSIKDGKKLIDLSLNDYALRLNEKRQLNQKQQEQQQQQRYNLNERNQEQRNNDEQRQSRFRNQNRPPRLQNEQRYRNNQQRQREVNQRED